MVVNTLRQFTGLVKEKGLKDAVKSAWNQGYIWSLLDGNLFATKVLKDDGKLVGVDAFGNKYYQKMEGVQYGRHRWVEYADPSNYNASTVPPEWHGWLHHVTDDTPDKLAQFRPRYAVEHRANPTGKGHEAIHNPDGHSQNTSQRKWGRVEPWNP